MKIRLPLYDPRQYQRPVFAAIEQGIRELLLVWARRGGKDFCSLDIVCMEAMRHPAQYWYALPQQNQVRKAVWSAVNAHTGQRQLDMHFPPEIVKNRKEQDMMLELTSGGTVQFIGSDNPDSLVGSGIRGVVNSEAALANPRFMDYIRPMLAESGGWELQNSTPRGMNHFYDDYVRMQNDPECFVSFLTVEDMQHISERDLERERKKKSKGLFLQEYYCSFLYGMEGAVYLDEMAALNAEGRYTTVDYDRQLPVWVAWDIGFRDYTSLVFFQIAIGGQIRVIDHYQNNGEKLKHYADVIAGKDYTYGEYQFLPHDGASDYVHGDSISKQLKTLGMPNKVLPRDPDIRVGIERTAAQMGNVVMDNTRCKDLYSALSAYRYEYDDKLSRFKLKPLHDWAADGSDSFRYALHAVKLGWTQTNRFAEPLDYSALNRAAI